MTGSDIEKPALKANNSSVFEEELEEEVPVDVPFKKCLELYFSKELPPKQPKQKFFFWFPPNQSSFEKKLVFKLDVAIMSYVCLSYFLRYLDANNISSAYVSGMKEDLNITGEEYVWLTQLFGAAYSFSGLFSTIILTRVRFSRMLPILEITWGLLTLFIYKANSFTAVAVLRFFQGLCEGAAWPAIHYILGSWYKNGELAKRTSIFASSGYVGVILSGLIQSALKEHLDGKNGISGWRWLFIIDACITFPIAILGLMVPDSPENSKPRFYLSQEELDFARDRVRVNGKKRVDKLDLSTFRRVFTSWQWYVFVIVWILWYFAGTLTSYMSIVLKGLGYDVYNRNNIPTGISGVGIVACLLSGFIVDILGRRIEVALILSAIWVIGMAIIKAWNVSRGALIFGYMLTGMYYSISPVLVGWCNELSKEDNQKRAATIGSLNFFSGLLAIPFTTKLFNTDFGPEFSKGTTASLIIVILLFFYIFVIFSFDLYQNRKRAYIKSLSQTDELEGENIELVDSDENTSGKLKV